MTTSEPHLDRATIVSDDAPVSEVPSAPSPSVQAGVTEREESSSSTRPARGFLPKRSPGPARTRSDKPPAAKPPRPRKDSSALKKSVAELYMSVGMMLTPFDQQCGMVICNSADQCADAMVKAAEENDAMMRVLQSLVATSAWGGVIAAHLPIIMAVAAHHVAPVRDNLPQNVIPFPEGEADDL